MSQITKLCEVTEGAKVVLAINGTLIKDAKVHLGIGSDGKVRVWFCQNAASGAFNLNPYGYRYAYSVGVNCDGTLRLEKNGIAGLRLWSAALDAAPVYNGPVYVLEDGSKVTADEYDRGYSVAATIPGYRVTRMKVIAVEENGIKFANGVASAGMQFKTVSKFAGAIRDRSETITELREEIAELQNDIADCTKAIGKYQANKARYNQFARKFGWTVVG